MEESYLTRVGRRRWNCIPSFI